MGRDEQWFMLVNISRSHILSDTLQSMMMMQCKRWLILCTVASGHLGSGGFIQRLRAEGRGSNMHDTAQLRWFNNSSYTVPTDWCVPHAWRIVPAVFEPGLSGRRGVKGAQECFCRGATDRTVNADIWIGSSSIIFSTFLFDYSKRKIIFRKF